MWTIFGILKPGTGPERDVLGPAPLRQKPFFSGSMREAALPPAGERDAAVLTGKAPGGVEAEGDKHEDDLRFVTLLSLAYF